MIDALHLTSEDSNGPAWVTVANDCEAIRDDSYGTSPPEIL